MQLKKWDSAEHLKTKEDIAAYLNACMEEGGDDPAFMLRALGNVARARNMQQLARDAGVSRQGIYKAFSGEGNPSFKTVHQIAQALGMKINFVP